MFFILIAVKLAACKKHEKRRAIYQVIIFPYFPQLPWEILPTFFQLVLVLGANYAIRLQTAQLMFWQFTCSASHIISMYCFLLNSFGTCKSQGSRGMGRFIVTFLYHFHPLYKHKDISWMITAESSPLLIVRNQT